MVERKNSFNFTLALSLLLVVAGSAAEAKMLAFASGAANGRKIQVKFPELPPEVTARFSSPDKSFSKGEVKVRAEANRDWGLLNIGFADAVAQASKSTVQSCTNEIVVAVVDTGVDYTHADLKDHLWVNRGEVGAWEAPKGVASTCHNKSCNGLDDDHNGYADDVVGWDFVHDVPLPYDTHGHGTHIAGIINASGNLGTCPRITLMPLKYYDNSGAGYNNLANTVRAIQYAVKQGANIINYSGGGADPAPTERAAIEDAQKHGILFVAAAGNDGHNNEQIPYFPASYGLDNIIGVASVNKASQLLPSSNFGKTVQIGAPGLMIMSTLPEGKFGTMSGTSQATAYVTGAAAFLAAQTDGPFDFRKVKTWILDGTKPMRQNEKHNLLSAGLLNLPRSFQQQKLDQVKPSAEIAVRMGRRNRPPTP